MYRIYFSFLVFVWFFTLGLFLQVSATDVSRVEIFTTTKNSSIFVFSDQLNDRRFMSFVNNLADGLKSSRLADVDLTVLHTPLFQDARASPPINGATGRICLESPWLSLSYLTKQTGHQFVGTVRLNERQFLRDLIAAGDWKSDPNSFSQKEFLRHAQIYQDRLNDGAHGQEIPAELTLLFKLAPQSTRIPFANGAAETSRNLVETLSQAYAQQILRLLDKCSIGGVTVNFQSITDLEASFGRSRYLTQILSIRREVTWP